MVDKKITQLDADGSPTADDLLASVNDPAGTPGNKKITIGDVLKLAYPVGSIYINASDSTNPATLLGFGTWTAFAAGRVPVGKAGSGTFNTAGGTGGEETHQLTTAEMPSHTHGPGNMWNQSNNLNTGSNSLNVMNVSNAGAQNSQVANAGGDTAHNNLQPYIVVYMWQRTA